MLKISSWWSLATLMMVGCGSDATSTAAPVDSSVDSPRDSSGDSLGTDGTTEAATDSIPADTKIDAPGDTSTDGAKCTTACDCEPGLGCMSGACISGIVPVYCCEATTCPKGAQCQHKADGTMDTCP